VLLLCVRRFVVAGQLQDQNQALLQQQEAFKADLSKHQVGY
jgi:hypothetical protein